MIFIWLRLSEQNGVRARHIQQVGIVDAFPARSVPIKHEYESRFNNARKQIDFLGFGLRALREDFGNDMANWLERVPVRILLLDPEKPDPAFTYAHQRDLEESNSPGSIATDIASFLYFMAPLKNKYPKRLEIRLYSCLPAINVCRIDDEIFWGPYIMGAQSRSTPTFLASPAGIMFKILVDHYDQIWVDGRFSRSGFRRLNRQYVPVI
ncbi:hypothetical protein GCM10027612_21450 [Microbispora bryophytorum subsp. camponoti]